MKTKEWVTIVILMVVIAFIVAYFTGAITGNVVGVKSGSNYKMYTASEIDKLMSGLNSQINMMCAGELIIKEGSTSYITLGGVQYKLDIQFVGIPAYYTDVSAVIQVGRSNSNITEITPKLFKGNSLKLSDGISVIKVNDIYYRAKTGELSGVDVVVNRC